MARKTKSVESCARDRRRNKRRQEKGLEATSSLLQLKDRRLGKSMKRYPHEAGEELQKRQERGKRIRDIWTRESNINGGSKT